LYRVGRNISCRFAIPEHFMPLCYCVEMPI